MVNHAEAAMAGGDGRGGDGREVAAAVPSTLAMLQQQIRKAPLAPPLPRLGEALLIPASTRPQRHKAAGEQRKWRGGAGKGGEKHERSDAPRGGQNEALGRMEATIKPAKEGMSAQKRGFPSLRAAAAANAGEVRAVSHPGSRPSTRGAIADPQRLGYSLAHDEVQKRLRAEQKRKWMEEVRRESTTLRPRTRPRTHARGKRHLASS